MSIEIMYFRMLMLGIIQEAKNTEISFLLSFYYFQSVSYIRMNP
jgi:hypothetical protein